MKDLQAMDHNQKNVISVQTLVQLALKIIYQEILIFVLHVLHNIHFCGSIQPLAHLNVQKEHILAILNSVKTV